MLTSALCMAHCLLLPLIFSFLPSLLIYEHVTDETHKVFGAVLAGVSLMAFVPGYRRHRQPVVFALGFCGLGIVLFAAFAAHRWLGESSEIAMTVAGSVLLILAHLRNRALCRQCAADAGAGLLPDRM